MWGLVPGGAFGICEAGRAPVLIGAQDQNRRSSSRRAMQNRLQTTQGVYLYSQQNGLLLSKCVCILHKQTLVAIILMLSLQMNTYLPRAN